MNTNAAPVSADEPEGNSSVSDSAASKLADWHGLKIDPATVTIEELIAAFNEQRNVLVAANTPEKQAEGAKLRDLCVSHLKSGASDYMEFEVKQTLFQHFSAIFEVLDFLGGSAVISARKEVDTFISEFKTELDWHLMKAEAIVNGGVEVDAPDTNQTEINAKGIRGLLALKCEFVGLTGIGEVPANLFKTGDSGKVGLNPDVMPRLPKSAGSAPAGRYAKLRHMEFVVSLRDGRNFIFNAGETTLGDIAHDLLSRGANRVTRTTIEDALKKDGVKMITTADWWTFETWTGTVCGRMMPTK